MCALRLKAPGCSSLIPTDARNAQLSKHAAPAATHGNLRLAHHTITVMPSIRCVLNWSSVGVKADLGLIIRVPSHSLVSDCPQVCRKPRTYPWIPLTWPLKSHSGFSVQRGHPPGHVSFFFLAVVHLSESTVFKGFSQNKWVFLLNMKNTGFNDLQGPFWLWNRSVLQHYLIGTSFSSPFDRQISTLLVAHINFMQLIRAEKQTNFSSEVTW